MFFLGAEMGHQGGVFWSWFRFLRGWWVIWLCTPEEDVERCPTLLREANEGGMRDWVAGLAGEGDVLLRS